MDAFGCPPDSRVSPDGVLLGEPITDDDVITKFLGRFTQKDMGDAGRVKAYKSCTVDRGTVREGDYVYVTPSLKGDKMELGLIEGLYYHDDGKMVYVRWLWHASTLTAVPPGTHEREVFLSDQYDIQVMENIEG